MPLHYSNHYNQLYPAVAQKSRASSFLLCRLFIASMPLTGDLFTQHYLHSKFAVVRRAFLAYQAIGWCNTFVRLGQLLEERFVVLKQAFLDDMSRHRL